MELLKVSIYFYSTEEELLKKMCLIIIPVSSIESMPNKHLSNERNLQSDIVNLAGYSTNVLLETGDWHLGKKVRIGCIYTGINHIK